jgi:hypothetical protein
MVTTRRAALAAADEPAPVQATPARSQGVHVAIPPSQTPARASQTPARALKTGRKRQPPPREPEMLQTPSNAPATMSRIATTTTKTSEALASGEIVSTVRCLRSQQTASPLQQIENSEVKRRASKTVAPQDLTLEAVPEHGTQQTKRKRGGNAVSHKSEPEHAPELLVPAQPEHGQVDDKDEDEDGIFFSQSKTGSLENIHSTQSDPQSAPQSPPQSASPSMSVSMSAPTLVSFQEEVDAALVLVQSQEAVFTHAEALDMADEIVKLNDHLSAKDEIIAENKKHLRWCHSNLEVDLCTDDADALRTEIQRLRSEATLAAAVEVNRRDKPRLKNKRLTSHNLSLRKLLYQLQLGAPEANKTLRDTDFGITPEPPQPPEPTYAHAEFVAGPPEAVALLHKIEAGAREAALAQSAHLRMVSDSESESGCDTDSPLQRNAQRVPTDNASTSPRNNISTPQPNNPSTPRPRRDPTSFFTRGFSAIKNKLGFTATPTVTPSAVPSASSPTRAPLPDTFTEVLSNPPTAIGERSQASRKQKKPNRMIKLLTKGAEYHEITEAVQWAKHIVPILKNDPDFMEKRTRLETPVLIRDLDNFPTCKPWENSFGDPLADMEDDDVVPVWAVYLAMLEGEVPKAKKRKAHHEVTMDVDDISSLNDTFPDTTSALHDSHGHSASLLDYHPRRSVEPSPMFATSTTHGAGQNIFQEREGRDTTAQFDVSDREALHQATKKVVHTHDPTQGSFGLDYDSDDEDTSMVSEESDGTAATPVWTQPPPPAPVPAHAPLPGQQPVDEIERQRQKLMKHTPAKPSRLREAFVPSPSLLSDAGNDSILMASPLPVIGMSSFDDMPDAEELGLTDEDWAGVEAYRNSEEWKAQAAATVWADPILTYGSDDEVLSPV